VIGAAGYLGLNQRHSSATKDRLEADLKVDVANVLVQAEYIHGWDGATGKNDPPRIKGDGFYATAGYTFAKRLQPVVRVGYLNPHIGSDVAAPTTANDRVWSYEAGANYFIEGSDLELQLSGGVFDYQHLESIYQGVFEVQVNF
jgi:predicted porin